MVERVYSDTYPKIELHVHLEQAVAPTTLFEFATRNDVGIPASSVAELAELTRFRDLAHFVAIARATMASFVTERDFREAVVDYGTRAHAQDVVYLELGFSPPVHARRGVDWDAMFTGVCDGAEAVREATGLEVRFVPDISRDMDLASAESVLHHAIRYRDRGIVGLGLAGPEAGHPPERFAPVFARALAEGLGSAPHAGEAAGPESVRGAIGALGADRIRHGIRAVEDPSLVAELAARGIVCDVCLHSNVQLGLYPTIADHPLAVLLEAGVACTVNTDDPTFFDCDLSDEHRAARSLGASPRELFAAGVQGAFCDSALSDRLRAIGEDPDVVWGTP